MKSKILKLKVDVISYKQVIKQIFCWIGADNSGKYICVSNVHMCMEAFDDKVFSDIVNNADLVVPDGKPLVWTQRLSGHKKATQVRGPDLFIKLCEAAQTNNTPIGLYGGTEDSLSELLIYLNLKFPNLKIVFSFSPPFRELTIAEEKKYINEIENSGAKILFLGIGCPKQEKWMARHKDKLKCIMLGVGAAFDLFSGKKKHAPRWMQRMGCEWLYRLFTEPRRVWKRYLKHNPRFIYYILKQLYG